MVVIRYEGPRGAPGMPELLDPTSRITALCRRRGITIALMTDARFSGGSVGLVIGHVSPEAALGGPIGLIRDGDTIVVDVNHDTLDCTELATRRRSRRGGHGGRPRPNATAVPTRWSGRSAPGCCGGCARAHCRRSRAPGCRRPAADTAAKAVVDPPDRRRETLVSVRPKAVKVRFHAVRSPGRSWQSRLPRGAGRQATRARRRRRWSAAPRPPHGGRLAGDR